MDPEIRKVERLRCEAEIFLRIVKKLEGVGFEPTTSSRIEVARKNTKSSTIHLDYPSATLGTGAATGLATGPAGPPSTDIPADPATLPLATTAALSALFLAFFLSLASLRLTPSPAP